MKRSTGIRERKFLKAPFEQRTRIKAGHRQEYVPTCTYMCMCACPYMHTKMHYKFAQAVLCNTHKKRPYFIIQDVKGII